MFLKDCSFSELLWQSGRMSEKLNMCWRWRSPWHGLAVACTLMKTRTGGGGGAAGASVKAVPDVEHGGLVEVSELFLGSVRLAG